MHIEVKRSSAKLKKLIKDAFDQLSRGILSRLFHEFCDVFGITDAGTLWNEFYGGGIVYATTVKGRKKSKDISRPQSQSCEYPILFDSDDFEQFWLSFLDEKLSSSPQKKCLFENNVFCLFTTFLAGYRPDFFISPVQCSLTVYENIFKHEINTINYYKTAKVGPQQRNTQNKSIKVSEFLQTLSIVKHKDIDLCEFSDFYLTAEQAQAIALIDSTGKFFPRRQIIFGPPGSGKSLVLMIKLFVLGQAEWRHDKTLYYGTSNEQHLKKLENFVANNRSAFCRPVEIVHAFEDDEVMRLRNAGADVILDELTDSQHSLAYLSDHDDDEQIVTFVTTGYVGSITHGLQASVWDTVNDSALKERNFLLTELKTVFRSTLQIQRWFHHFDDDRISNSLISGHNFTGIAVEEWIFTEERIVEAVNERIRILLEVEKCKPSHIVLYLPMPKHRECHRHIVSDPLKVITAFSELRSMEFPVVILVDPGMVDIYLSASRAQCHLIVFASENGARQLRSVLAAEKYKLQTVVANKNICKINVQD